MVQKKSCEWKVVDAGKDATKFVLTNGNEDCDLPRGDECKGVETIGSTCNITRTESSGGKSGPKKTSKTVNTPKGKRVVYMGPRGGEYVKLDGKMVPLSKLPVTRTCANR